MLKYEQTFKDFDFIIFRYSIRKLFLASYFIDDFVDIIIILDISQSFF